MNVTDIWRRAKCADTECAEARLAGDTVMLRSSKLPDKIAMFDTAEWDVFLAGVKAGDFDDLTD